MEVSAIWIRREGDDVVLTFENNKQWRVAARAFADSAFSHIVELNHTGPSADAGKPRPVSDFPRDEAVGQGSCSE